LYRYGGGSEREDGDYLPAASEEEQPRGKEWESVVMTEGHYLMESEDEALRLDLKTDRDSVLRQARWAGVQEGMRLADLGCGSGKTTSALYSLVAPGGEAVGVDIAEERIAFAREKYQAPGLDFRCADIRESLEDLGSFDFLWVRFVLEYYLRGSGEIVRNISRILRPGGLLCLLDLDNNCLCHYRMPPRLERTLHAVMDILAEKANFDAFAGRKLYSYLYDLGFEDIRVAVEGHHLIYGELGESDSFNWMKKIEVAPKKVGFDFAEYPGGFEEFREEFELFFGDPRRFTYSPLVSVVGRKGGF
jgi:SAM-dependent methyltransferase